MQKFRKLFGFVLALLLSVSLFSAVISPLTAKADLLDLWDLIDDLNEDDDYYYYVKAVPKVNVSMTRHSVRRIGEEENEEYDEDNYSDEESEYDELDEETEYDESSDEEYEENNEYNEE